MKVSGEQTAVKYFGRTLTKAERKHGFVFKCPKCKSDDIRMRVSKTTSGWLHPDEEFDPDPGAPATRNHGGHCATCGYGWGGEETIEFPDWAV